MNYATARAAARATARIIPADCTDSTSNALQTKLPLIQHYCLRNTPAHAALFQKRAEELIATSWICEPNDEATLSKVKETISYVAKKIKHLETLEIEEKRRDQVNVLTEGLKRLEKVYLRAPTPPTVAEVAARWKAEKTCIEEDRSQWDKSMQYARHISQPSGGDKLLVKDMDTERLDQLCLTLIKSDYPTCKKVRDHLQAIHRVDGPELWARYQDGKYNTPEGLFWELLPNRSLLDGCDHLDLVRRPTPRDYIVAMKYIKKDRKGYPVPLDVASIGKPCCKEGCKTVKAHLDAKWPNYLVRMAQKLEEKTLLDVLDERFDDGVFDLCVRTLILVAYVDPKP